MKQWEEGDIKPPIPGTDEGVEGEATEPLGPIPYKGEDPSVPPLPTGMDPKLEKYPDFIKKIVSKISGGEPISDQEKGLLGYFNIDLKTGKVIGPMPELPPPPR